MARAFSSAKPQAYAVLLRGAGCGDSSCGSKDISAIPDEDTPPVAPAKVTGAV